MKHKVLFTSLQLAEVKLLSFVRSSSSVCKRWHL